MHVKLLYFCVNLSCELLKDHPIASLPAALKVIEITGKSHANISMYVDFFFIFYCTLIVDILKFLICF